MRRRFKVAWCAFFGGPIGAVGWCGQIGYWWTQPCQHAAGVAAKGADRAPAGCGWFDGEKVWEGTE